MKRVLVIGSGKRIRRTVLPALICLSDRFVVEGVYSRSVKTFTIGDRAFTTSTDLAAVDMAGIDLVMMAIPVSEVPEVLKRLSQYDTKHMVLMLDTPVIRFRNILSTKRFRTFKSVLVSEDTIALPPFVLARQIIRDGRIGKLEKIDFLRNGYKYHALASLKMLAGADSVSSIANRRVAGGLTEKRIGLSNGVRAVLLEPRDYSVGGFALYGTEGSISDISIDSAENLHIGYLMKNGLYAGLSLDGRELSGNDLDLAYLSHRPDNLEDSSLMNCLKIRGLMELIVASAEADSSFQYSPLEALVDKAAITVSERGYYLDFGLSQLLRLLM